MCPIYRGRGHTRRSLVVEVGKGARNCALSRRKTILIYCCRAQREVGLAEISQRTVAYMINLVKELGCYDTSYSYTFHDEPLVSASRLKNLLYKLGMKRPLLDRFERERWDFEAILPKVHDGSIFDASSATSQRRALGQAVLEVLVKALHLLCGEVQFTHHNEYRRFIASLKNDGFVFSGPNLVMLDRSVIDEPAELSALERTIAASPHDNKKLLLHHLHEAQRQTLKAAWGPAAGEWRKFYEETLQEIWRLVRLDDPQLKARPEKPNMKDLRIWLENLGLFTSDETIAYGAVFGFLSLGNHPGVSDEREAHFCMILSMIFVQAALEKMRWWADRA
jgi:hypothetical protein